jgi:ATP:corrinoid adenosyltransferase
MALSKNLIARVTYSDLRVELIAEGAVWNPDIADDLIARVKNLWRDSLESMVETNAWKMVDVDELDD